MTKLQLIFFSVTLLFSGVVQGDDWSQYRGPLGDGKSTESIGDVKWNGDAKELWKVPTPLGFSSFSISNGKAFTLVVRNDASGKKNETCVALDVATGKELWNGPLSNVDYPGGGDAGANNNQGGDGPRSTPVSDGENVFIYDVEMVLHCLDASNGKPIWSQDIRKTFAGRSIQWKNATSPVLHDDAVYIGGGGPGQSFLAFEAATGKLRWKSGDEMFTHATPQIARINDVDQLIYFVQSGLVSVKLSDGTELWRTKFDYRTSTAASPVVQGNLVYCSAGYGVGAGLFEIGPDNKVTELWTKPNRLVNHWSTPVVHEGHLYGLFEFKKYGNAPLQCVELATGEIKWSERGFGPGNCILAGDKLIVLSDAGEVAIVAAQPDAYHELARAKVLGGKCWSTPAYSNGRIYVRSTTEAACIDIQSP